MNKSILKTYFCLLFLSLHDLLYAQSEVISTYSDSTTALNQLARADTLFDSNQFKEAYACADSAYRFFRTDSVRFILQQAEAAFQSGRATYRLKNYPEAQRLLNEAVSVWDKYTPLYELRKAKAFYFLAYVSHRTNHFDEAITFSKKALDLQVMYHASANELVKTYLFVGQMYIAIGQRSQSTPYFEQCVEWSKPNYQLEDPLRFSSLSFLADNYKNERRWIISLALYEQAIAVQQKMIKCDSNAIAVCLIHIGEIYQILNKNEIALSYYKNALDIQLQLTNRDFIKIAYSYSRISGIYYTLNDFNSSLKFATEEYELLKANAEVKVIRYACIDLAKACLANKEYLLAQNWLNKALEIIGIPKKNSDSSDLAITLLYQGRIEKDMGNFIAADSSFQISKKILVTLFGPQYESLNFNDEELGNLNFLRYLKDKDPDFLYRSRDHYITAVNRSKQALIHKREPLEIRNSLIDAVRIFERAIKLQLPDHVLMQSDDDINTNTAWNLSEYMHNYVLFSRMKDSRALNLSGIHDTLLRKDSLLKAEIIELNLRKKTITEQSHNSITDSNVLGMNKLIFDKQEKHKNLIEYIEKTYPEYSNRKFDTTLVTVQQVQERMNPDQTLLEYYCGDSSIFVFVIQKSKYRIKEIKRDFPLKNWIDNLNQGINGYHTSKIRTDSLYRSELLKFTTAANQLYNHLVLPVADSLTPELIIIPDAVLAKLPFETLLASTPKDFGNFKTYNYLIAKHSIRYSYSASMLYLQNKQPQLPDKSIGLLAFAPFYEKNSTSLAISLRSETAVRYGLSELPYSGEEIYRAKMQYGDNSVLFTGKQATKQKFIELSHNAKIIHLATHGKANYTDGDFSFVAFSPSTNTEEHDILSATELYNMKVNPELIILSACETANGERHHGEGIVSIASAFKQAGAKSIVASLWNVNDKSTMLIMDQFYKAIKIKKSNSEAIAFAKREYLKLNPGPFSHPFYWAAFIFIGEN
jgi:CHAT domain-containing protein